MIERLAALPPATRRRLVDTYGASALEIAAAAERDPSAHEPVAGGPDILAQVDFAMDQEFARRLEDVLLRRLPLGHDPAACRRADLS